MSLFTGILKFLISFLLYWKRQCISQDSLGYAAVTKMAKPQWRILTKSKVLMLHVREWRWGSAPTRQSSLSYAGSASKF